ncbi:ATP-binding protein [sulfur-oxidizing endosymbiont of Gigantopelta aegis]|uniref:ATP-binding protein n=1 Tax=sulfur-oxidizing endosymbiont of Gigantopelta aegis TaxID=2794934 RepID=UPI001BE3D3A0|nr:ATP-binding protein [sulfur-oxidizing endosymbiont of Gigantopelta aegis]
MADIKRNLHNKINELMDYFPCLVIWGPRQCGKTVLSKMLRPNWAYFDLENPQTFDKIHDDLNFFFQHNNTDVIIDEAQLSPDLFRTLRGVIDDKRSLNNRFILTGSSSPELLSKTNETLAGRVATVELSPFKVNELQQTPLPEFYSIFNKPLSIQDFDFLYRLQPIVSHEQLLNHFLQGGYPTPTLTNNSSLHKNWMEQYFANYILRDVRNLFPKMDTIKFRRFSMMLTALSGTIINRSQLGRSLDVNESTVKNYLDIAHGTMIWRNIPSFERSKIKSIIKMPKGIFRDSGLNNYLQNLITFEQLHNSPLVGQNFESFIIEEVIRGVQASQATRWNYSYFRTKSGSEVDLVLSGEFGLLPIEIKYGTDTRRKQLTGLQKFITDNNAPYGIVINNSEKIALISDKIIQIPAVFI